MDSTDTNTSTDEKLPHKKWHVLGILFLLFFSLVIITLVSFYKDIATPLSTDKTTKIVRIPNGANLNTVALILKKNNLIKRSVSFVYLAKIIKKANKLQAGEYKLSPSMTSIQILENITKGRVVLHPVTIPEGYNIRETAELLASKGFVDKDKFISLASDKQTLTNLNFKENTLEGYLFPNTYYFSKDTSEIEVIKKMISTFNKTLTPELVSRAKEIGFTINKVITLASLIEKETGKDSERELISAVFHNRLKKNMRLQCDPTVIYAMGNSFNGNIRKKDLFIDSPYNTYRYAGLPPGPISNPGKRSIEAALYPAEVKYLYFVAKHSDGEHQFSEKLHDHNAAVRKYQLRRRR